jgi:hypothetical protein
MPSDPPRERQPRFLSISLCASILTGLVLRLWNLPGQVMGGDELHAVRAAARMTLPAILTTYSVTDYSIPLTALERALMEAGFTLSEWSFRSPALLCGCAALYVVPRLVVDKVDRAAAAWFGWLLAVSPALVLYSRIARSYAPMLLAGVGAVFAFEAWWRTQSWRYVFLYLGLAGLAVWIHLGAGTLVVAPFLFALGDLVRSKEDRGRRFLRLVGMAAGLGLTLAAFLVPAWQSFTLLLASKRQDESVPLAAWGNALRLQAGSSAAAVAALFWLAALLGLFVLCRDRPRFGLFTLTAAAAHVGGLLVLSPLGMGNPVILDRYLLPVLPFVLLWLAYGLGRLWSRDSPSFTVWAAQRSLAVLVLLLLVWAGPFSEKAFRTSSFMHHNDFVGFFAPPASLPAEVVPEVYRRLPGGPVVETPWPSVWDFCRSLYGYQQIHGQRVLVSAPFDVPRDPRLRLRNEVPPEPAALLASPARTVIVHLRLPWEEDRVIEPPERTSRPWRPNLRHLYRQAGERLAARLREEWGPPDFADASVQAWDLDRVRGGRR